MSHVDRRRFLTLSAGLGGSALLSSSLLAQPPADGVNEPVFRVAKVSSPTREHAHPLDPALSRAYDTLSHIRQNVVDYTAIMIRRERINGTLNDYEFLGVKVRNRKMENGVIKVPLSIYISFLKPSDLKGREAIYIENKNNGKLVVHEGGFKGKFIPTVELDPNGMIAMRGQRYPITEAGVENLCVRLIEKGERDRKHAECLVNQTQVKLGERPGLLISVEHPERRPHFDFHKAEIFIDQELNVPTRYAAYYWPSSPGGQPEVIEEYTYQNVRLNIGLQDIDFDQSNPKYNF